MTQSGRKDGGNSIPADFHALENVKMVLHVLNAFALWLVPGFVAIAIFANTNNEFVQIITVLLTTFIAGHGLQCVGQLGHEGTHFALHKDRWTSAVLGVLFSSFVPLHMDVGFGISHADHHIFTNTDKDPDVQILRPFKNFFSRLLLARSAASRRYFAFTLRLAFNRWDSQQVIRVGLHLPQMVRLARINLVLSLVFLAIYASLTAWYPKQMVLLLWAPLIVGIMISGLRPYVEHMHTHAERGRDSRTWISPVFDFLYGGINYHQAHHLWPQVPSYKLKALHKWMTLNKVGLKGDPYEITTFRQFVETASLPHIQRTENKKTH